jgi:hypothetical protein
LQIQRPGRIYLARAPIANESFFTNKGTWQWWDGSGWTGTIGNREPVINSSDGVCWCISACYNPGLKRYFLISEFNSSFAGNLRFYHAAAPQGPWATLRSFSNIRTQFGVSDPRIFYASFAPKWFRNGGQDFTLIWTGTDGNDSWNTTHGSLVLSSHHRLHRRPVITQ